MVHRSLTMVVLLMKQMQIVQEVELILFLWMLEHISPESKTQHENTLTCIYVVIQAIPQQMLCFFVLIDFFFLLFFFF